MMPLIIIGLIVGLTTLLLFLIRTNSATVFLTLCSGIVLLKFVGEDANLVLNSTFPHQGGVLTSALNITLVVLPALIATFLLRKRSTGPKVVLNLLPSVLVGLLVALSVIPLISVTTRDNIMHTQAWTFLDAMQGFIVSSGVFVSLLFMKSTHKKPETGKKKGHK